MKLMEGFFCPPILVRPIQAILLLSILRFPLSWGEQLLVLPKGASVNLARKLHLAQEIKFPASFFHNSRLHLRDDRGADFLASSKEVTRALSLRKEEGALVLENKGKGIRAILAIPFENLPTGAYEAKLFFRTKLAEKVTVKALHFHSARKLLSGDKDIPGLISTEGLRKILKELGQSTRDKRDICLLENFPPLNCDIFKFNDFAGTKTAQVQELPIFQLVNQEHPYTQLMLLISSEARQLIIEKLSLTSLNGVAYRDINPKLPNVAGRETFADERGVLYQRTGMYLPTGSMIAFNVLFPEENQDRLQLELGLVNNRVQMNYESFDQNIHPSDFSFKVAISCDGEESVLDDQKFTAKDFSHSTLIFHRLNAAIPDGCKGRRGRLRFSAHAGHEGKDTLLFLSNPRLMNLAPAPARPNLLIITADALRMDHTGLGERDTKTTPMLKLLATQGATFNRYFVQRTLTETSFPIFFSGLYPFDGSQPSFFKRRGADSNSHPTLLPEILQEQGHQTLAMIGTEDWDGRTSFLLNFDQVTYKAIDDKEILKNALDWVKNLDPKRPFFLWIHLRRPHMPYDPDQQFRVFGGGPAQTPSQFRLIDYMKFVDQLPQGRSLVPAVTALYDGNVLQVDHQIASFLLALEKIADLNNTVTVISSDHGENMDEASHYFMHGTLQNSSTHVPLLIIYPPKIPKKTVISDLAEEVDVVPTVLELLGIQSRQKLDGKSLMPLLRGEKVLRKKFVYGDFLGKIFSIQNGDWKYVYNPEGFSFQGVNYYQEYSHARDELFRVARDPQENDNRFHANREEGLLMREKLVYFYKGHFPGATGSTDAFRLDPEIMPLLKRTGYLMDAGDEK